MAGSLIGGRTSHIRILEENKSQILTANPQSMLERASSDASEPVESPDFDQPSRGLYQDERLMTFISIKMRTVYT